MKHTVREAKKTRQLELLNGGTIVQKVCRSCGLVKLIEDFHLYVEGHSRPDCKSCHRKKQSDYMNSIKDKRKVYRQRQRALVVGAPDNYSMDDYEALKSFSGGKCLISGKELGFDNLQFDHFMALSNKFGLGSTKGNLILVSEEVNQKKRDMDIFSFMESERSKGLIDIDQLKNTLRYLAESNGLKINEYIQLLQGIDEMEKASRVNH